MPFCLSKRSFSDSSAGCRLQGCRQLKAQKANLLNFQETEALRDQPPRRWSPLGMAHAKKSRKNPPKFMKTLRTLCLSMMACTLVAGHVMAQAATGGGVANSPPPGAPTPAPGGSGGNPNPPPVRNPNPPPMHNPNPPSTWNPNINPPVKPSPNTQVVPAPNASVVPAPNTPVVPPPNTPVVPSPNTPVVPAPNAPVQPNAAVPGNTQ